MFDINYLYRAKIGGTKDTLALTSVGMALLATTPGFSAVPAPLAANLAAIGAGYFTWKLLEPSRKKHILYSKIDITSDASPAALSAKTNGLLVGYTTDKGLPVVIPDEDLMRHLFIVGQSGVGKTVMGSLMLFQQIQRGGGVAFVDGKMNMDDLTKLWQICCWCGREQDLLVINPGNPEMSNTYNPILNGDADEIASRILSLIPSTESSAGSDHYKQSALQGLTVLIAALQKLELAFNFMDLSILLTTSKALEELHIKLMNKDAQCNESKNLSLFIEQFKTPSKDSKSYQIDVKKMKDIFGGMGSRLFTFGSGTFGQVLNTYDPEVNLFEAVRDNKIVYVMLPTMGKNEPSNNFGKMLVGDLRTAVSWLQKLPEHERPNPPFLSFFDEAGSYISDSWSRLFEQSRSAHMILCPAVQTFANLQVISPELAEMVLGNTWTKLYFKIGTQETALASAELIGQKIGVLRTLSDNTGTSISSPVVGASPEGGVGQSIATTLGEREQETYRVSADDLKALTKGECIVTYGGDSLFNLRIPMLHFDKNLQERFGPPRINRFRKKYVQGANYFANHERYINN